jgi:hypothetical protein
MHANNFQRKIGRPAIATDFVFRQERDASVPRRKILTATSVTGAFFQREARRR